MIAFTGSLKLSLVRWLLAWNLVSESLLVRGLRGAPSVGTSVLVSVLAPILVMGNVISCLWYWAVILLARLLVLALMALSMLRMRALKVVLVGRLVNGDVSVWLLRGIETLLVTLLGLLLWNLFGFCLMLRSEVANLEHEACC